jgi:hypothetical protein
MAAHGKMIELTSGRWKEIWWVNGGVRISKIIASRRVWPVLTLFVSFFGLHFARDNVVR